MSWLILALIAMVLLATSRVIQRSILKSENSDPLAEVIVFQIIVAILFTAYAFFTGFNLNGYLEFWPWILASVILYSIGGYLMFLTYKFNDASTATILLSTSAVWAIIAGFFILRESLNIYQIIGAVLILASILVINMHPTSHKASTDKKFKGLIIALASSACFGTAFIIDNLAIGNRNVQSYLALTFALPAFVQVIFLKNPVKKLKEALFGQGILKLLVFSLIYGAAVLLLFTARQIGGTASIISTIQQAAVVPTVIMAAVFLNERENLFWKLVGSMLCVIAIVLFAI